MADHDRRDLLVRLQVGADPSGRTTRDLLIEIHERLVQEQQLWLPRQRVVQQLLGGLPEIGLHLRTHHADPPTDLRQLAPDVTRLTEHRDVRRVGKRTVSRDEREQRRLAAAVLTTENPALALPHRPREILE